jgi:hypothetical protein
MALYFSIFLNSIVCPHAKPVILGKLNFYAKLLFLEKMR